MEISATVDVEPTTSEECQRNVPSPATTYGSRRVIDDENTSSTPSHQLITVIRRPAPSRTAPPTTVNFSDHIRGWRRSRLNATVIIAAVLFFGALIQFGDAAPVPICRTTCRGKCKQSSPANETVVPPVEEFPTQELIDSVIDDDTGAKLLIDSELGQNSTTSLDELADDVQSTKTPAGARSKRQSYVERRTCSSRFQLEIVVIPASILMIPLALCGLLLCVFCCGPKDSRGKIPNKMCGFRVFDSDSDKPKRRRRMRTRSQAESDGDELEYGDGYVQRKSSKKTRFATDVQVYEVSLSSSRRQSAAQTNGSLRSSAPAALVELSAPALAVLNVVTADDPSLSPIEKKQVDSVSDLPEKSMSRNSEE